MKAASKTIKFFRDGVLPVRILISGGSGQLGTECSHVLGAQHSVLALSSKELDITDASMIEDVLSGFSPEIVLNCSAFTNVDACEREMERAWDINVTGAQNLALYVNRHGGRLVHISTDYIFDGRKKPPGAYVEDDIAGPLSYYGTTKLESEKAVRKATDKHCIVRTAWMYGATGNNFLKAMLKKALENPSQPIRVVNDRYGSPTWAFRLALQIKQLIEGAYQGTFHATAEGYCTWYELACYFLSAMGVPHPVQPCSGSEYIAPAVRPVNSILENQNLKKAGINLMQDWRQDIDEFVLRSRDQLLQEVKRKPLAVDG